MQEPNLSISYEQDLVQAISSLGEDDIKEILADVDPVAWTEYHRRLKGKPFSFNNRNYLLQPYRDNSKNLIFYKGRQVEMSEFSMNWLLRKLSAHPYTAGIHAMPRSKQAENFSKQRLSTCIEASPTIYKWYNEKESALTLRKFTKDALPGTNDVPYNFYILGGTWESRKDTVGDAARGMTLDFIVYDERQDHPDDVETVLGEGAAHSEYKQTLTLGTPKLPGTQFDVEWESSTKNLWMITCPVCGRQNNITIDNIMPCENEDDGFYYGCPECKTPLDRTQGIWLPSNPQRRPRYVGYHINQLMVPWITANEIWDKFTDPKYPKRRFYNEVVGESYGGDDVPITLAALMACREGLERYGSHTGRVAVGIDWGVTSYCWVLEKVGNGTRMVELMTADNSDPRQHPRKFAEGLRKYGNSIHCIVCDAGPDIMRYYELVDSARREGIVAEVWPCYYATPPAKNRITWSEKGKSDTEKDHYVTAGRSELIEEIANEVHMKYLIIPKDTEGLGIVDEAMDHMCNLAAVKATTSAGTEYIQYQNTGPDHFMHAKIYATVAADSLGSIPVGSSAASFTQVVRDKYLNGLKGQLGDTTRYKELVKSHAIVFKRPPRRSR